MADSQILFLNMPGGGKVPVKAVDAGDGTFLLGLSIQDIADGLDTGLGQQDKDNSTPVVLASNQDWPGASVLSTKEFTRPSDTTLYTTGDVVGPTGGGDGALDFTGAAAANGGSGWVVSAQLLISVNQSLPAELELHLFNAAITAGGADNAAVAVSDSDMKQWIGAILFQSQESFVIGANRVYQGIIAGNGVIPFKCGGASTTIYGVLVVRNGYTPASASVWTINLGITRR